MKTFNEEDLEKTKIVEEDLIKKTEITDNDLEHYIKLSKKQFNYGLYAMALILPPIGIILGCVIMIDDLKTGFNSILISIISLIIMYLLFF